MPNFAQLIATKQTLLVYKGVLWREYFPNSIWNNNSFSRSSHKISDWFAGTVEFDVQSTADDRNIANNRSGRASGKH